MKTLPPRTKEWLIWMYETKMKYVLQKNKLSDVSCSAFLDVMKNFSTDTLYVMAKNKNNNDDVVGELLAYILGNHEEN